MFAFPSPRVFHLVGMGKMEETEPGAQAGGMPDAERNEGGVSGLSETETETPPSQQEPASNRLTTTETQATARWKKLKHVVSTSSARSSGSRAEDTPSPAAMIAENHGEEESGPNQQSSHSPTEQENKHRRHASEHLDRNNSRFGFLNGIRRKSTADDGASGGAGKGETSTDKGTVGGHHQSRSIVAIVSSAPLSPASPHMSFSSSLLERTTSIECWLGGFRGENTLSLARGATKKATPNTAARRLFPACSLNSHTHPTLATLLSCQDPRMLAQSRAHRRVFT